MKVIQKLMDQDHDKKDELGQSTVQGAAPESNSNTAHSPPPGGSEPPAESSEKKEEDAFASLADAISTLRSEYSADDDADAADTIGDMMEAGSDPDGSLDNLFDELYDNSPKAPSSGSPTTNEAKPPPAAPPPAAPAPAAPAERADKPEAPPMDAASSGDSGSGFDPSAIDVDTIMDEADEEFNVSADGVEEVVSYEHAELKDEGGEQDIDVFSVAVEPDPDIKAAKQSQDGTDFTGSLASSDSDQQGLDNQPSAKEPGGEAQEEVVSGEEVNDEEPSTEEEKSTDAAGDGDGEKDNEDDKSTEGTEDSDLAGFEENQKLSVAGNRKVKKLASILFLFCCFAVVSYLILGEDKSKKVSSVEKAREAAQSSAYSIANDASQVPAIESSEDSSVYTEEDLSDDIQIDGVIDVSSDYIPDIGEIDVPPPPSITNVPELIPDKSAPKVKFDDSFGVFGGGMSKEDKRKQSQRRKANVVVYSGGSSNSDKDDSKAGEFLGFGEGALDGENIEPSASSSVKATKIQNLNTTIAQGKIIYAILETAINTNLPGVLRGIVTRDVYAETGKNVLIPKGSRLIGKYNSTIKAGQHRVGIIWQRVIRPDGVDIAIADVGVDHLGRSGVGGDYDNKFWSRILSAYLVSHIIPKYVEKAVGQPSNETKDAQSETSSSGDNITVVSDKFSDITAEIVRDTFSEQPTIMVDQGTKINIFVQQDLVFPPYKKSKTAVVR